MSGSLIDEEKKVFFFHFNQVVVEPRPVGVTEDAQILSVAAFAVVHDP
jgi:hypothetical protein